jgi:hypothetical protein
MAGENSRAGGFERFEQFCFEFFRDGEVDIGAEEGMEVAFKTGKAEFWGASSPSGGLHR